jgi:hypothetical protein
MRECQPVCYCKKRRIVARTCIVLLICCNRKWYCDVDELPRPRGQLHFLNLGRFIISCFSTRNTVSSAAFQETGIMGGHNVEYGSGARTILHSRGLTEPEDYLDASNTACLVPSIGVTLTVSSMTDSGPKAGCNIKPCWINTHSLKKPWRACKVYVPESPKLLSS